MTGARRHQLGACVARGVAQSADPLGHLAAVVHVRGEVLRRQVASSLLLDVHAGRVDAAMVLSNDSDLRFPLEQAREHKPVATINPSTKPTAADLRGRPIDGAGRHWWRRLRAVDFFDHQLPDQVGELAKPEGW